MDSPVNDDKSKDLDANQDDAPLEEKYYFFADEEIPVHEYNVAKASFSAVDLELPYANLPLNFAGASRRADGIIYLCGGLTKYNDTISDKLFEFDPVEKKLKELPSMDTPRYSFCLLCLDYKLYVLGGRTYGNDQEALLRTCQYFDLATNKWTSVASMKERRCSFQAFVYNGEIWALGGYTDVNTRSTIIEKYNPSTNTWTKLPFRLQVGLESGHIASFENNKVILFGGQNSLSPSYYCHELDLLNGTILNLGMMLSPCLMGKVISTSTHAYVFGQDDRGIECFQSFNFQRKAWEAFVPENINLIMAGFRKLTMGSSAVHVKHSDQNSTFNLPAESILKSVFLFGTDDEPFIASIDKVTFSMQSWPCPLQLRLKNYQAACRVNDTKVLFAGGVTRDMTKVSNRTYLLDLKTFKAIECQRLNYARFAFEMVYLDGYVYAIGGRHIFDHEPVVMSKCERFDLQTLKWEIISAMNFSRSSCMVLANQGKIYVAGGHYYNGGSLSSVECFDPKVEEWSNYKIQLPIALEAASSFFDKTREEWIIIGGKAPTGLIDAVLTSKIPSGLQEPGEFSSDIFIVQERCLQKTFLNESQVIILGGTDDFPRFAEVLDKNTFFHQDEETSRLLKNLTSTLSKLNFNGNFLRPNTLV